MRQFNRFVENTHPGVLILGALGLLFFGGTVVVAALTIIATAWGVGVGMIEASGIQETLPMVVDALDGDVGG